jgi:hypothetical protein
MLAAGAIAALGTLGTVSQEHGADSARADAQSLFHKPIEKFYATDLSILQII